MSNNRNTEELAALIKARIETAKEEGVMLSKDEIVKEFELSEDEVDELNGGGFFSILFGFGGDGSFYGSGSGSG